MLVPAVDASARHAIIFVGNTPVFLPTLWLGGVSMLAMARLFDCNLVPIVTAIALIIAPLGIGFRNDNLWGQTQETLEANYKTYLQNQITIEDNFYKQPALLADALAGITPQREGVPEIFFIGFAGDGYQNVFRKEVDAVTALIEARFDAVGHTIRLVNNVDTVSDMPIASLTSLQFALKKVAGTMDIKEDVLMLFLTSHGSDDHQFSLTLAGMQFKTLNPKVLRESLDTSGIKNRVVIISACYSGGFVEALKNENTLVIAAAAPDRKSFGCSNTSEWTYFEKAYFDEALRQTTSFTKAFDIAAPILAARESSEGFTKSLPMMAEGKVIGAKLAAIERRLDKKPVLK